MREPVNIELLKDYLVHLDLIEIKSSQTFQPEYMKHVNWLNKLQNKASGVCIYAGEKTLLLDNKTILPWNKLFSSKYFI